MSNRFYAFFGENRASLAMDIEDLNDESRLTFALAFCNERDQFNKRIARDILNGRLDARIARLNGEHEKPVKHTFVKTYRGTHPKRDVMTHIMDILRELPKFRDHDEILDTVDAVEDELYAHFVGATPQFSPGKEAFVPPLVQNQQS